MKLITRTVSLMTIAGIIYASQRRRRTGRIAARGIKGVCYDPARSRYRATIAVNGKYMHLGRFSTSEEAQKAYSVAAEKYHGEFARLE
jgi:hypothetical protein